MSYGDLLSIDVTMELTLYTIIYDSCLIFQRGFLIQFALDVHICNIS